MTATASSSPPPLIDRRALADFLDQNDLGSGEVAAVPLGSGHSNPTFLVTRESLRCVLRRPPSGPFPPGAHDVLREVRFISALGHTTARVPELLAVCPDERVLGVPFYLTAFIDGIVFSNQLPAGFSSPDTHHACAQELVDALVEIHAVDWRGCGLGDFMRGTRYLERQLDRFAGLLERYRTRETSDLNHVTRWLSRNVPPTLRHTLVHGDYRLGNVIFGGSAPVQLSAVLDWELATIGDPLADLGYMLAMWAQPDDPVGLIKLAGATATSTFPRRGELLERYLQQTGGSSTDIAWYVVLALWKFCVIMEGLYRRTIDEISSDPFARDFAVDVLEIAAYARRVIASSRSSTPR